MNHDKLLSVSEDSEKFNRDAAAAVVVCQCVATASVALSAPLSAPHSGPVTFSFVTCQSQTLTSAYPTPQAHETLIPFE